MHTVYKAQAIIKPAAELDSDHIMMMHSAASSLLTLPMHLYGSKIVKRHMSEIESLTRATQTPSACAIKI